MEAFARVVDDGGGEIALKRVLRKMYELPREVRPSSWMVEVARTEGGVGNRMARGIVHFTQWRPAARRTPWVASRHKAEQGLNRLLFAEGVISSEHRPMLLTLTASVVTHRVARRRFKSPESSAPDDDESSEALAAPDKSEAPAPAESV